MTRPGIKFPASAMEMDTFTHQKPRRWSGAVRKVEMKEHEDECAYCLEEQKLR